MLASSQGGHQRGDCELDGSDHLIHFSDETLRCDRTAQWRQLEERFSTLRGTLLVAGPEGEAHEHFLERLKRDPPGRADVVPVQLPDWQLESDDDCDHQLSKVLSSPHGELARRVLARRCRTHKVVLLTGPTADLTDAVAQKQLDAWFGYVRRVFDFLHKELGDQPGTRWPLFVQPVSWPRRTWQQLTGRLRLRQFTRPRKDDRLEFVALPPLHRIRPDELLAFFDEEARAVFADRVECQRFVNEVCREKTSVDILRRVEKKLRHALD